MSVLIPILCGVFISFCVVSFAVGLWVGMEISEDDLTRTQLDIAKAELQIHELTRSAMKEMLNERDRWRL